MANFMVSRPMHSDAFQGKSINIRAQPARRPYPVLRQSRRTTVKAGMVSPLKPPGRHHPHTLPSQWPPRTGCAPQLIPLLCCTSAGRVLQCNFHRTFMEIARHRRGGQQTLLTRVADTVGSGRQTLLTGRSAGSARDHPGPATWVNLAYATLAKARFWDASAD